MAKNRDPQPANEATSEEEESETESESESESDSEGDQTPALTKGRSEPLKAQPPPPPPPPQQQHTNSDDSESGSDSESDESSDDEVPSPPKPVADVQKPSSTKRPTAVQASSPKPSTPSSKLTGVKRAVETNGLSDKDVKKSKNKSETSVDTDKANDSKRPMFQRIWSQDDEIVVLRGIFDYVEEKKADPYIEITAFHDFIKKKLQVTVNKDQLRSKIRSLKQKFTNNKSKEVNGEDRVFSKPHEHLVYQLSKKIWGKGDTQISVGSPSPKVVKQAKKKEKNLPEHNSDGAKPEEVANPVKTGTDSSAVNKFRTFGAAESMEEMIQRLGTEMFEGGKVMEGSKAWMNLKQKEMEMYLETLQVKMDRTKLVLDALKSGNL